MPTSLLDPNAIMAATSVVAAITAIVAIWLESRRSRFASGVDLIQKLDREFRSEQFLRTRAHAARALLSTPVTNTNAIDEILDFFEEVAFFVRRGALDRETTWYFFFSYIYRFNAAATEYVVAQRRNDATLWHNYITVYPRLLSIEQRERATLGSRKHLSENDVGQFLREESCLLNDCQDANGQARGADHSSA